jgi:hypothetical protein
MRRRCERVTVKSRQRPTTLFATGSDVVQQRIHSGSGNIRVLAEIELGIEARTGLTALLPAIREEMQREIGPACRDIGIARKIVSLIEQTALPDFPHDPPLLAPPQGAAHKGQSGGNALDISDDTRSPGLIQQANPGLGGMSAGDRGSSFLPRGFERGGAFPPYSVNGRRLSISLAAATFRVCVSA